LGGPILTSARRYDWQRLWVERDDQVPRDGDGFAYKPEAEWAMYHEHPPKTLAELADERCLVLLGEPGMGKTFALSDELARLEESAAGCQLVDLKGVAGETALRDRVRHALGDQTHVLLFDSLDEGLLRVDTIFDSLIEALKREAASWIKASGTRVRIACRSAEWPADGKERLEGRLGEGAVKVLLLAPLTRADVSMAARAEGLDAGQFIGDVIERGAVPLVSRPVTCRMLLGIAARREPLPRRQTDLYEKGCLALADEIDEKRRKRGGLLPASRRLAIARRIAALTVFSNRAFVDTSPVHQRQQEALWVDDIVAGEEVEGDTVFQIDADHVREVLDTALFRSSRLIASSSRTGHTPSTSPPATCSIASCPSSRF